MTATSRTIKPRITGDAGDRRQRREADKASKADRRRDAAQRRAAFEPVAKEIRATEALMERLRIRIEGIEEALADPALYERDPLPRRGLPRSARPLQGARRTRGQMALAVNDLRGRNRRMTIRVEKDDAVTIVTIDRPQVRNAVDPETALSLFNAFMAFERDDSQAVAVLTGTGGAFSAGFDLKWAAERPPINGSPNRSSTAASTIRPSTRARDRWARRGWRCPSR